MEIGILALQGDFREHAKAITAIGHQAIEVRNKKQLDSVKALIIPGGESTTILKLLKKYKLDTEIQSRAKDGMPMLGTCAGAIVLSKNVEENNIDPLKLIDITIKRNAYGRQIDSFEANITLDVNQQELHAIFIRAPQITSTGKDVVILAQYNNQPVLVKENGIMIATFHPELTDDLTVHNMFVDMI